MELLTDDYRETGEQCSNADVSTGMMFFFSDFGEVLWDNFFYNLQKSRETLDQTTLN